MPDLPDSHLQPTLNRLLTEAIEAGAYDDALTTILKGADPRHDNEEPLRTAAARGHTAIVQMLLELSADPSVHDHKPLRDAVENGHFETAHVLREAGSYNPFLQGEYERAIGEGAARHARDNGENADDARINMMRILQARHSRKPTL